MQIWGLTDTGNVRKQNQDDYRIVHLDEKSLLAIVCDGMGGAKSGNVASRLAGEVFAEEIKRSFSPAMTGEEAEKILRNGINLANISVFEHAQLSEEFQGMGTTLVAVLAYERACLILNVGDSRAYHINQEGIRRITTDHSVVELMVMRGELTAEEAKTHPSKNLITRAVGTTRQTYADVFHISPQKGDSILLCTDGLSNQMSDQEMLFEILHGAEKEDCCQRLLEIAKERGAPDNVTAVLLAL